MVKIQRVRCTMDSPVQIVRLLQMKLHVLPHLIANGLVHSRKAVDLRHRCKILKTLTKILEIA